MKGQCQEMAEKIKAPDALKNKVLDAACAAQSPAAENARHQPGRHTVFRAAVCAACAFALVLSGGLHLFKPGTDGANAAKGASGGVSPAYHFGLAAYAADLNETYAPQDDKIAFSIDSSSGGEIPGKGGYTGCLFRITGDGIQTVSASIDRGGFYRYKKFTNLTRDGVNALRAAEADAQFDSSDDENVWRSEQVTAIGSHFSEDWTADGSYGFWVPPELIRHSGDEDLQAAAHRAIDLFDGATLTITAAFNDGSQQTKTLRLKTGRLKCVLNEDRTHEVLPELAADNEPYMYGVYAELEK